MLTRRWPQRLIAFVLLCAPLLAQSAAVCQFDAHGQLIAPVQQTPGGEPGWGGVGGTGVKAAQASQPAADGWGGIGGTGVKTASTANLAGYVLFAGGQVLAQHNGLPARKLARGDAICEGDDIATADQNSMVQIRMRDHGAVMLYADSALHIDTFRLPAQIDGSERLAMSLEHGGMRAMTGEIGHVNKANYLIQTPAAEIHIRGTDHEVFYVPTGSSSFRDVAPGTYNHVISGGTTMANASGSVRIEPAESAFAPLGAGEPQLIDALPAVLRSLPLRGASRSDSGKSGSCSGTACGEVSIGGASGTIVSAVDALTPLPNLIVSNNVVINPDSEPNDSAAMSAYVGVTSANGNIALGAIDGNQDATWQIGVDPVYGLPQYVELNDGSLLFVVDDDTLQPISFQSAQVDGATVYWGVYNGGASSDAYGDWQYADLNAFAFSSAGSTPLSVIQSMSGTLSYSSIVGATAPIDEYANQGGQLNSLSVQVTFGANPTIDSYAINVTDGQNRQWNAASTQAVSLATFKSGNLQLSGSCNGCQGSNVSGTAAGVLIGNHAGGLITSYTLHSDQQESASGVAVLKH